ncbi:unnamed protein product [Cylindrotheca closterium]|uniref:Cytochrome P450 n=1 Tax=Cylindrotheca closterium TaxID=2856 RepID=A0AAD2FSX5_9STRA|nr:unnamed protein product [Cylindrotheca closterium]
MEAEQVTLQGISVEIQPISFGKLAMAHLPSILLPAVFFCIISLAILFALLRRKYTQRLLESCGLPTLHWRPRFVNYKPFEDEQKLASSSITRILPRMQRLKGPYGMYGTVYGISTAVVHVAHPVPTKAIFGISAVSTNSSSDSSRPSNAPKTRRRSSVVNSTGASKAPAYNHFKNFCGEGVFTADGDDWKAKRASVMHCLIKGTNSSLSEASIRLEQEANQSADAFCAQIKQLQLDQHKKRPSTDIVPLLQRATVGLIYRYITHDEPNWQKRDGKQQKNGPSSFSSSSSPSYSATSMSQLQTYMESIIRIRMIILAQSRSIWFLLPRWCYRLFSSLYKDEEETLGPIRSFAEEACHRAKPGSPLANLSQRSSHGGVRANNNTESDGIHKDLLDETITLLFAGQDTSAATLSWTLHLLSLYPDIQTKLAEEIKTIFEEDAICAEKPTVGRKTIVKLHYLDAVLKESMRLYPVAPFVVRKLTAEVPVPADNPKEPSVTLPAGSIACIWIYGLHHNPKFWDRPNEFRPERWLDPQQKDPGQTNGAYMPFASGPRNCVGQPLAYIVLRTLLSRIISEYEFRDEKQRRGEDPGVLRKDMQAGFTVLPNGGVTLTIHKRQQL